MSLNTLLESDTLRFRDNTTDDATVSNAGSGQLTIDSAASTSVFASNDTTSNVIVRSRNAAGTVPFATLDLQEDTAALTLAAGDNTNNKTLTLSADANTANSIVDVDSACTTSGNSRIDISATTDDGNAQLNLLAQSEAGAFARVVSDANCNGARSDNAQQFLRATKDASATGGLADIVIEAESQNTNANARVRIRSQADNNTTTSAVLLERTNNDASVIYGALELERDSVTLNNFNVPASQSKTMTIDCEADSAASTFNLGSTSSGASTSNAVTQIKSTKDSSATGGTADMRIEAESDTTNANARVRVRSKAENNTATSGLFLERTNNDGSVVYSSLDIQRNDISLQNFAIPNNEDQTMTIQCQATGSSSASTMNIDCSSLGATSDDALLAITAEKSSASATGGTASVEIKAVAQNSSNPNARVIVESKTDDATSSSDVILQRRRLDDTGNYTSHKLSYDEILMQCVADPSAVAKNVTVACDADAADATVDISSNTTTSGTARLNLSTSGVATGSMQLINQGATVSTTTLSSESTGNNSSSATLTVEAEKSSGTGNATTNLLATSSGGSTFLNVTSNSAATSNVTIQAQGTSAGNINIDCGTSGGTYAQANFRYINPQLNLASSNPVELGGGSGDIMNVNTSTLRHKTRIRPFEELRQDCSVDSSFLYDIQPIAFRYKNGGKHEAIGFLAEQIDDLHPLFATKRRNSETGEMEVFSVRYKEFVVPLVEQLQVHRQVVEDMGRKMCDMMDMMETMVRNTSRRELGMAAKTEFVASLRRMQDQLRAMDFGSTPVNGRTSEKWKVFRETYLAEQDDCTSENHSDRHHRSEDENKIERECLLI